MSIRDHTMRRAWRAALWLFAVCLWLSSVPAWAQLDPDADREGGGRESSAVKPRPAQKVPARELNRRKVDYVESSASKITIYKIVQETIDDFIADTRDLKIAAVSPVAVRNVGLTPNLNRAFGDWVEAELVNAMAKHTDIRVKRCIACRALKTRLDGNDWVVSLGHITQEQLAAEARRLGVVAYLDAFVAWVPGANIVSVNVQIYRATDGKVLWTETYQSDATTAAILRSGERVLTRDEARAELVRKLADKPYFGYALGAGAALIPYTGGSGAPIAGGLIGGKIFEVFGENKRFLYGFHGEGFINVSDNPLLGAFVGATFMYQINEPNLNDPTFRVGGIAQGFIAGTEGNSGVIEAIFEGKFNERMGASAGAFYFFPVDFAGGTLGGPGIKVRFILEWL